MSSICDKCGELVERQDDSTFIEACIKGNSPLVVLVNLPRHIKCSPSRAQYIVHSAFPPVVDNRRVYDKRTLPSHMKHQVAENEQLWTAAWLKAQILANTLGDECLAEWPECDCPCKECVSDKVK